MTDTTYNVLPNTAILTLMALGWRAKANFPSPSDVKGYEIEIDGRRKRRRRRRIKRRERRRRRKKEKT